MTRLGSRPLVAVAVAMVLALGALLGLASRATSAPVLPEVAPDALLASVAAALAAGPSVSGEVVTRADLGLPDLSSTGLDVDSRDGGVLSLLRGEQRLRVWHSTDGMRVASLGEDSERALIAGCQGVWTWNSDTMTVTAATGPPDFPCDGGGDGVSAVGSPLGAARAALDLAEAGALVSVDRTARVAGRDVYTLVLVPRSDRTLIDRIEIGVDAAERLPLRTAVYGKRLEPPALEAAFTQVSFAAIDPATFTFSPPPGAEVENVEGGGRAGAHSDLAHPWLSGRGSRDAASGRGGGRDGGDRDGHPLTAGAGWERVVALPLPAADDGDRGDERDSRDDGGAGLGQLRRSLPFEGTLFSARMVDIQGSPHLMIGAVGLATLDDAADRLR